MGVGDKEGRGKEEEGQMVGRGGEGHYLLNNCRRPTRSIFVCTCGSSA